MKEKINSICLNKELDHKKIYNLFNTHSSKVNKKISEKIGIFKNTMDFFEFYSNKDIKNLFNIFEIKLSENNDEFFSSFNSDIDKYISCISQIILSIKLFLKTKDILTEIVIKAKNNLSKLKYENKLENNNQDYLFLYLESLLKISQKNLKFDSSNSTLLSNNISSIQNNSKKYLFRKPSFKNKIDDFSNLEKESIIYNTQPTPKFESDEEFEKQEKENSNLEFEISSPKKSDSILTLSKYVFDEEPFIPPNLGLKLIESPTVKPKLKNSSTKGRMPKIKNFNKHKKKRNAFSEKKLIINNKKKHHCRNLLEMINKIYKKGFINSEEKLKLKQLVIEKSNKIEYFYYNIYKNLKNDKNTLLNEIKKIAN